MSDVTTRFARQMETNRASWDRRTPVHVASRFYDVDAFRAGACSLMPVELALVGDVRGRSLLHLQCHFGQDTLSWARRGARVCGLDLSEVAIDEARSLARSIGIEDARFVASNVYDASRALGGERFDVVYTSYGVLGWLPELDPWAREIAACLRPGGVLHVVEFHPILWMLDFASGAIAYPYDSRGVAIEETQKGTYADRDAPIEVHDFGWNHSLGSILGSLQRAGLTIEHFEEHDTSPYDIFGPLGERVDGGYRLRSQGARIPYLFALTARA